MIVTCEWRLCLTLALDVEVHGERVSAQRSLVLAVRSTRAWSLTVTSAFRRHRVTRLLLFVVLRVAVVVWVETGYVTSAQNKNESEPALGTCCGGRLRKSFRHVHVTLDTHFDELIWKENNLNRPNHMHSWRKGD